MKRRRFIVTAVGTGPALSGCINRGQSSSAHSPSDSSETKTSSSSPTETTSLVVAGDGNYPHPIRVENTLNRSVSLTIRAERDGMTVYQDEHTIDSESESVVASITKSSLPEDSRSVTVVASEANGQTTSVTVPISTSVWYIRIYYGSNETLRSTYATQ
jgi:hypothetical protein